MFMKLIYTLLQFSIYVYGAQLMVHDLYNYLRFVNELTPLNCPY